MDLFLLRIAVLLAGCGLGAAQDAKSGIISDKITYSMVVLGIIFNLAELNWIGLAMGAAVFAIGYAIYYSGKIGGGDVKLFTGIALLLPFFGGKIFVISVLVEAAITAVIFYSVFFIIKYARTGISLKENTQGIKKSIVFGIIFAGFFYFWIATGLLPLHSLVLLAVALCLGLVFLALEKGIRKNFFLKKIKLAELEEDEVIASEFLDENAKKQLALPAKGIIGEKEKQKLSKAGITEVLVYRNLPPFGPFILIGAIMALAFPGFFEIII
ncbi:MAG: A24 family peptidase [Candidatus ainarchaeum sp.]|nr:A24 family peptidase [Candidatus ainarchaeum sp.]